ncbi:MAG: CPBP family intramembrane glutamic endopeptidase [Gemmatimonadales bacterium]|nr:CPBP family intramembrane glutamic endopeptidase [Gemmatimonadales bacterium]
MRARVRAVAKAIGVLVAFVVVEGLFGWELRDRFDRFVPGHGPERDLHVRGMADFLGAALATLLIGRWAPTRLGVAPARDVLPGAATGFGIGAAAGVIALALAVPAGGAAWSLDGGTAAEWLRHVGVLVVLLLPAAAFEELVCRGVPFRVLAGLLGAPVAAILLSAAFAALHLSNPGITPLALVAIFCAGLFLTLAVLARGGLWTATGAHLGWNLALAALAAPVSGLAMPAPLLDYAPGGPAWLTGGAFGPEGGALGLVALLLAAAAMAWWRAQAPPAPAGADPSAQDGIP